MYEALELRDGGKAYMGKGVQKVTFLFLSSLLLGLYGFVFLLHRRLNWKNCNALWTRIDVFYLDCV